MTRMLLVALIAATVCMASAGVGAAAFPADWTHSDLIEIRENSGSDLIDYQILVELNASNFDFSKAQSDGADIRFAELDDILMSYWIESWNSTAESAKVWVKVPSIPASDTATIRLWYGNAGATSESNFTETMLLPMEVLWHTTTGYADNYAGIATVDVDSNNNIYGGDCACYYGTSYLIKFDPNGTEMKSVSMYSRIPSIKIDESDNIFVSNGPWGYSLRVYDPDLNEQCHYDSNDYRENLWPMKLVDGYIYAPSYRSSSPPYNAGISKFDASCSVIETTSYHSSHSQYAGGVYHHSATDKTYAGFRREDDNNHLRLARFTGAGSLDWDKPVLSDNNAHIQDIIHENNYLYISGTGETDEIGANTYIFLAKYDLDGNQIFMKKYDDTADYITAGDALMKIGDDLLLMPANYYDGSDYFPAFYAVDFGGNLIWRGYVSGTSDPNRKVRGTKLLDDHTILLGGKDGNCGDLMKVSYHKYTSPEPTVTLSPDSPPFLTITAPAPDTATHSPTITVTGTASDPSGIASVTVNGAPATGTTSWSAEVALDVGDNTITVVVTNTTGGSRTETITITYDPLTTTPSAVLSTTLSGRYATCEPIELDVAIQNTGASAIDVMIDIRSTSGFSDISSLDIPGGSSTSTSFDLGSAEIGTYDVTVDIYVDSVLLESDTKSYTVFDPESLKFISRVDSLEIVSLAEFDQMARIVGDDYYSTFKQYSVGCIMNVLNGPIKDFFFNEEMAGWAGISPDIFEDAFTEQFGFITKATGVWETGDVWVKEELTNLARETYLTDEIYEVTTRQIGFESYAHSQNFEHTTEMDQRLTAGEKVIEEVTESKPVIHVPIVGYDYTILKMHNTFKFVDSKIGKWIGYAILAVAVAIIICTVIGAAVGAGILSGGSAIVLLILHIGSLATSLFSALKAIKFVQLGVLLILCLMLPPATDVVANNVTEQHDLTLDTIEDIIASHSYTVSINKITPSSSYIGKSTSVALELDNKECIDVEPIVEMMVISPDGRIIDIKRQDPDIKSLSAKQVTQSFTLAPECGNYNIVGMVHAGSVATSITQQTMSVDMPNVTVDIATDSLLYNTGDTVHITANFTNNEPDEITNLTCIVEVINTTTADVDIIVLSPDSTQTKTLSFTPTDEGSYITSAILMLGFTELTSMNVGFVVGSGEGLVINTVAEDLYPPEADVTLSVTIENIGTVHTNSTINITTFDELTDFSEVCTGEISVSLDSGASTTLQPTVLSNAPPGIYRTIITAGNYSAQSVGYTVTANGTIFTLLDTDKLYYNLTDSVNINITTNDVLFNATNASVNVSVTCTNGTVANPVVSGSDGDYTTAFNPASNGTYKIVASSQKTGFRTYSDETFVIVGARSTLNANLPTNNITHNQTVFFECNITNEHGVPIKDVIVTITGCGTDVTKLSDGNGIAEFVVTPDTTGTISFMAEKGGYTGYTSTVYVFDEPDSTVKGDLNSDGNITAADAAIALAIAVGGSASCDPATLAAADISRDGKVTSLDALMILQAAGSIEL